MKPHLNHIRRQETAAPCPLCQKIISPLEDDPIGFGDRLSDKIAQIGGSWAFIFGFLLVLSLWMILNLGFLLKQPFDPYPFIFLNLILSCVAALQAPIIMMSQNRHAEKDRRRAEMDYKTNLKAEMEIQELHSKVDLLLTKLAHINVTVGVPGSVSKVQK